MTSVSHTSQDKRLKQRPWWLKPAVITIVSIGVIGVVAMRAAHRRRVQQVPFQAVDQYSEQKHVDQVAEKRFTDQVAFKRAQDWHVAIEMAKEPEFPNPPKSSVPTYETSDSEFFLKHGVSPNQPTPSPSMIEL